MDLFVDQHHVLTHDSSNHRWDTRFKGTLYESYIHFRRFVGIIRDDLYLCFKCLYNSVIQMPHQRSYKLEIILVLYVERTCLNSARNFHVTISSIQAVYGRGSNGNRHVQHVEWMFYKLQDHSKCHKHHHHNNNSHLNNHKCHKTVSIVIFINLWNLDFFISINRAVDNLHHFHYWMRFLPVIFGYICLAVMYLLLLRWFFTLISLSAF